MVDVVGNCQKSTVATLQWSARQEFLRRSLLQACDELGRMTDTGLEFALCELSKIVGAVLLGGRLHNRQKWR